MSEEISDADFDAKWKVRTKNDAGAEQSVVPSPSISYHTSTCVQQAQLTPCNNDLIRKQSYFMNDQLDSHAVRRGLNDLFAHDLVPEPAILAEALRACRRVNDFPT
jgi:cytochrome c oxidase subunit 5a